MKNSTSSMTLKHHIYKSAIPEQGKYASRFDDPEKIQGRLESICIAWKEYLEFYISRSTGLFGKAELPWLLNERSIISTLAASISRKFPDAIILEELGVTKPGSKQSDKAIKSTDLGRCDLWAAIRDKTGEFNFYLEAKMSPRGWKSHELQKQLHSWYGISKIFRDYQKGHPERLLCSSPHRDRRDHPHYIIGMLVTRLDETANNLVELDDILRETFEKRQVLLMRRATSETNASTNKRLMVRFPTVALLLVDGAGENRGFIASFTVLGATPNLKAKSRARKPTGAPS